jgi:hypothetical protein
MKLRNERMNMNSHLRQEKTLSEVSLSIFSCLLCPCSLPFILQKVVQVVQLPFVTKVK